MDDRPTTGGEQRDGEQIAGVARGDRNAFQELFRGYEGRLFRYFARLVRDATLAEELVVDTLLEVWRGAARFGGRSRPSTWIFGIAHHKAVDALRRRRPVVVELEEAAALADPEGDPEARAGEGETRRRLRQAMARLSPPHREVLQLTFFHGLTCAEAAGVLHCPVNTVKTRMHYARQALRPILEGAGIRP
jgi:RNA polymerase sigma-70 factor (ECF subfamily)